MSIREAIDPTESSAWKALVAHAGAIAPTRDLIDSSRDFLRLDASGVLFDFSRQRIDEPALALLLELARHTRVTDMRDAMFAGEHINTSEGRAVLHTALRLPLHASLSVDGQDVVTDVHDVLDRMRVFAEAVRTGEWRGASGRAITDVVNIGIGGSDLGPAMAYRALRSYTRTGPRFHFISNVDPADIAAVLEDLDPATTLFIIASKTFTTQETMTNAQVARRWIIEELGNDAVAQHFVAVSTNEQAVIEFGVQSGNVFGFWDWVGGRYSMTSAIGLSTLIAVGPVQFRALLDGFAAIDEHFRTAPADRNVPLLMGLIAVWNRNFLGIPSTAVLPYSNDLSRFPAYLQQLAMESNGKRVRRDGAAVNYATGGIVWGEPGTNGQHSFYQLLHQGTDDVASDIIVVANPAAPVNARTSAQHDTLVAHALAQASVLTCGVTEEELRATGTPEDLIPHKAMVGNHPTSVVMMPELTPFTLGVLIAAYEHSVFVQGAVWQINSFDQWGVELGKKVAAGILSDIESGVSDDPALDGATQASVAQYLAYRSVRTSTT
ncbi:MAG: glucose-6-phosphate isomerase [Actinomycetota bacterium]